MDDSALCMATILVVYYANDHRLRAASRDHLYCFRDCSRHRTLYLNLAVRRVPRGLRRVPIDLVLFHTLLLSCRWSPPRFRDVLRRAGPLSGLGAVRAALPQDEFFGSAALTEFIESFDVGHVFSSAPESQWPAIYGGVDRSAVTLHEVLTGYVSDRLVDRFSCPDPAPGRPIDVGYRAWRPPPSLGEHARLKVGIAEAFQEAASRRGLRTDISTRAEDTVHGDDWYRFLQRCRFTIGVEGGASILDRDGGYYARAEAYLAEHPGAPAAEVAQQCFPEAEGSLALHALSPRHLEACVTGTCQVLVEGCYGGALEANRHYIPLRRDLGNIEEVLDRMGDDEGRAAIARQAYRDVVASGRFAYRRFVDEVVETCLPGRTSGGRRAGPAPAAPDNAQGRLRATWLAVADRLSWVLVRVRRSLIDAGRWLRLLPGP